MFPEQPPRNNRQTKTGRKLVPILGVEAFQTCTFGYSREARFPEKTRERGRFKFCGRVSKNDQILLAKSASGKSKDFLTNLTYSTITKSPHHLTMIRATRGVGWYLG